MARMVDISSFIPENAGNISAEMQLGAAFKNMSNQSKNPQPQPGSFAAQFQLGKDYQNLGMGFQNAFSQNPQQINPLGAFFLQNRPNSPQYNSLQNVMNYQNSLQQQPAMGSIMGLGAQQSSAQPVQQSGGFMRKGIFGGLF